ncbi:hypothetical protein K469DRAFT_740775 [Zopfia rhizophila CBS 207.26]|uniref:Fungal N-terminal domain-containing protein n=1 Tax=Zopfia rhizophila CBS 207.26 TaxID=1314779 RepID=A0A6A6DPX6_9PEZI|nr:hypothetical protein K469DRAFT_740775 [Zopfia rhizophila CBS 207.26]
MSGVIGLSPSDIIKLVEISTRIYIAFKDANDNSESQVEGLVKEFSTFHHCLLQLEELMKEYDKPLPFPYLDFKETLERCQKTIKPYAEHLVDNKRMTAKKFSYTIRYIGKETEIDRLRKQITGHYQALQMCISFLQLRLHLEATKQTQRLLDSAPFRSMSIGNHLYTSNAIPSSSRAIGNAIAAPSEADQLYQDWLIFHRWLKYEDERLAQEGGTLSRPRSLDGTLTAAQNGDAETAAVLYRLRRELEDAIMIEENRAKRIAVEKRTNLSPSDAIRQEIKGMPPILPQRSHSLDSGFSEAISEDVHGTMADSTVTIRPSLTNSPQGSPVIEQAYFSPADWSSLSPSIDSSRNSSILTNRSSISAASVESQLGISAPSTAATSPEDHALRTRYSVTSLATLAPGDGALKWNKLCRKVQVERHSSKGPESKECDIHWSYREDHGLSIRSVHRDRKTDKVLVWATQHFPATGPSIPLTTTYPDGDLSIDFPRGSFGRLDKRCIDIKYTFCDQESSTKLQTLLYTNNGKDEAELLFDRPIITISSDKNKPECRGKNIRLWRRAEQKEHSGAHMLADVLVLLFYTSALPEERGHWVEEPHYVFEWLEDSVYKKSSEKLTLVFSKEPGKWTREKLFKRRKSSKGMTEGDDDRKTIRRNSTAASLASSTLSCESGMNGGFGSPNQASGLNRFGYSELEIKFRETKDRKDFLAVWKAYVKPLGQIDAV